MRHARLLCVAVFCVLLAAHPAAAVPAFPDPVILAQPDGTVIVALPFGDEWDNGYETLDGYTLIQETTSGYWQYAAALRPRSVCALTSRPPLSILTMELLLPCVASGFGLLCVGGRHHAERSSPRSDHLGDHLGDHASPGCLRRCCLAAHGDAPQRPARRYSAILSSGSHMAAFANGNHSSTDAHTNGAAFPVGHSPATDAHTNSAANADHSITVTHARRLDRIAYYDAASGGSLADGSAANHSRSCTAGADNLRR